MVALLLATFLVLPSPLSPRDSIHVLYANRDTSALQRLHARAPDRATDLLCRYRLYPLTEDGHLLDDLPEALEDGTAQEYALLAGLWGYRAARAPLHRALGYGLRSERLLKTAKALDADDPYVLLVDGQSLLFKPGIWGGDKHAALGQFRRLRTVLGEANAAFDVLEADVWIWYALDALGNPAAETMRRRLLERSLPVLYRAFLNGRIS